MKKIDLASVPAETGCNYPYPFNLPCSLQSCQRLARHGGLTLFGVNLTVIEPGGCEGLKGRISSSIVRYSLTNSSRRRSARHSRSHMMSTSVSPLLAAASTRA
jgi:hypothetical protein